MFNRRRSWLVAGLAIIAVLVAIGLTSMVRQSRESTLQVNLHSMREVIKQYTADQKRAPQSLQDLVDAGYYRELPLDPLTNSRSTWKPVKTEQGIVDVRSGSMP